MTGMVARNSSGIDSDELRVIKGYHESKLQLTGKPFWANFKSNRSQEAYRLGYKQLGNRSCEGLVPP